MFVFAVVATVSLGGLVWFNSFQHNIFALLNPGESFQERFYAQARPATPFAFIGKGLNGLRASIYSFLNIQDTSTPSHPAQKNKAYLFPISDDR